MGSKVESQKNRRERGVGHISVENVNQNNLLAFCEQRFSDKEFVYIKKAWDIAHEAHKNIKRETGVIMSGTP